LLKANWAIVKRVANALCRQDRLTTAELDALLGSAPTRYQMPERHLQGKAYSRLGGTRRATLSGHSTAGEFFSAGIGTETTLGLPHAVEMRTVRDMNCMVVINRLLTTATTRPAQSTTGAPEREAETGGQGFGHPLGSFEDAGSMSVSENLWFCVSRRIYNL
jgi:hypothetical protein